MSYGRSEEGGKDIIVFLAEDDAKESEKPDTPTTSSSESASSASASAVAPDAQGAYNEETGEINWDCPCLGPMTKPPCGDTFKEAFSCFVYSKAEPKGIDCVEQFRAMQSCFREHPDIYGEELDDEGDDKEDAAGAGDGVAVDAKDVEDAPAKVPAN